MRLLNWRSLAPLAGAAFIALDGLALLLPGRPPRASETAHEIATSLAAHRTQVLVSTLLAGLSLLALMAFLDAIERRLGQTDEAPVRFAAARGGALAGLAAQWVGMAMFFGATFRVAAQHHDAIVRALTDGGNAAIELSKFGFATLIVAVCVAGRHTLANRMVPGGLLAAALMLLSTVPLVSSGSLTQFGGGVDLAGSLPGTAWLLVLSVMLARTEAREQHVARPGLVAPAHGS